MMEGRPHGIMFESYRKYKTAKRNSRRALDEAYEQYTCDVHRDIDEAAKIDIRLFWKLRKRRKPEASRIFPEIRDEKKTTNPDGVTETFAQLKPRLQI